MSKPLHISHQQKLKDYLLGLIAGVLTALAFSLLLCYWLSGQEVETLQAQEWSHWLTLIFGSHLLNCSFLSMFLTITRSSAPHSFFIGAGMMSIPARLLTSETQIWATITLYAGALGLGCFISRTLLRRRFC